MFFEGKEYRTTFHAINTPVARKPWKCSLCGEYVKPGDRYVLYTWRQTTRIDTFRFHPVCYYIVKHYCKLEKTNLFTPEAVNAWLKTRRHCRLCKAPVCHKWKCEKVAKWVNAKPLLTYYDKLKPMEDKPDESMFKILDE